METVTDFVRTGLPQNVEQWITALVSLATAIVGVLRLVRKQPPPDKP